MCVNVYWILVVVVVALAFDAQGKIKETDKGKKQSKNL